MNDRDRRAVLWGGAVIVGSLLLLRVLPRAAHSFARLRDSAEQQQRTLVRAREVLAQRDELRDSLGRVLGAIVALAPKLVDGQSTAEAQASLSSLVSLAAGRHALRVVRLDPLPDSAAGVFSRVAVHAELEGDVIGLARLLRAVETADPMLSVMTLGVSALDGSSAPGRVEALRVEMDVAGYYLPRGAK